MQDGGNISIFIAFSAGIFSFFSPCVFPLIPSYVAYISGMSYDEMVSPDTEKNWWSKQKNIALHSLFFVAGLSLIFISLGAAATSWGGALMRHQDIIQKIGGGIIIFFGIFIMGIIKFDFLEREKRFYFKNKPAGYAGSLLLGMAFASGWTPCIGPVLGSILLYVAATQTMSSGIMLLAIYSLGMGLPFIICSLTISKFISSFSRVKKYIRMISIICGLLLVIMGILVITNNFNFLSNFFS